ncbi:universal stress protein [Actinomadura barringtoniae]|uniref:Universal stress protein n=1 Tax=Actinomadura barringtoniae TaxID=1427535 RepID=A0A939PGB0_9ACTN|nr:universal stress protein [Actinomadura barringtoniae]MBO2451727.1 universal stress protein [Actinomadura barringtoniae]
MAILIAYDGSEDAKTAIEFAAKHLTPEPTVILSVWEPLFVQLAKGAIGLSVLPSDVEGEAQSYAESAAKEGAELAKAAGFSEVTYRSVADKQSIWATIVETAEEIDASVIVTGSRGLAGIRSVLLGSVSNHVLHHAHRPTLVVPPAK